MALSFLPSRCNSNGLTKVKGLSLFSYAAGSKRSLSRPPYLYHSDGGIVRNKRQFLSPIIKSVLQEHYLPNALHNLTVD